MAFGGLGRRSAGTDEALVDGRELLSAAILALPVPTAPPARSSRHLLGLHLIQSGLRLEHVDRVSEKLTLVDATHMARHMDIDVDVEKLPDGKEAALTVGGTSARTDAMLWIPVGRHPRESLGPVSLRDADDRSLSRVSSRETNRLLASGIIQLLRVLINSDDSAEVQPLRGPNRESRWLLEAAVLALVEDGRGAWPRQSAIGDPGSEPVRAQALACLATLLAVGAPGDPAGEPHALHQLLATLTHEQIIVAMVPPATRQLRVSYDAPELGARPTTRGSRIWLRSRDFTVRYVTTIPADLDSFHVSVVVPEEMEVRHFLMASDADANAARVLRADVANLVTRLGTPTELATSAALLARFEAQGIESRLAEIGRRRAEDFGDYVRYLRRLHARVGQPAPAFPGRSEEVLELDRMLRSTRGGRRLVTAMTRLRRGPAGGPDLWRGGDPRHTLDEMSRRIGHADLGHDLHLDNDPRESAGHIQWRRHATGLGLPSDQEVHASVFISIGEASPSAAVQVFGFTVLNVLLVVGLILGTDWAADSGIGGPGTAPVADGGGQSEVLVTLLLLIPGILLSRFDLAPRRSVLSRIRRWPRRIAWASVIVNSLLALWAVVSPTSSVPAADSVPAVVAVAALLMLVVASAVHALLGFADSATLVPPYVGIPAWLRNEVRVTPPGAVAPPSVTFAERAEDLDV